MSDCTERRYLAPDACLAGEGRERMHKEGRE
jgi:hypothetical protein